MLSRSALKGWSRLAWEVMDGVFSLSVTSALRTPPATLSVSAIFIRAPGVSAAPFTAMPTWSETSLKGIMGSMPM